MMWLALVLLVLSYMTVLTNTAGVPVVYVLFGLPPLYMQMNIELALRTNPVIILSDSTSQIKSDNGATYVDMGRYKHSGLAFEPQYKHMSKDISFGKRKYELQCFIRWFVLRDYMVNNNIERVFFGDGDTAVFANMTNAFDQRSNCSAVVNVELQMNIHHWVAAGESSLWTIDGINSFCNFTLGLYQNHFDTLLSKYRLGSTVTDMSALWFWWVATHRAAPVPDWVNGRPYQPFHCERNADPHHCQGLRDRYDSAFNYARQLRVPPLIKELKVCNGLDVVNRTAFDHMHGWLSGSDFSFNFNSTGVPTFVGNNSLSGGKPESLDPVELQKIGETPISLMTLHYQGDAKNFLLYDLCRVLLLTGGGAIRSGSLRQKCEEVKAAKDNNWPACKMHIDDQWSSCV